MVGWQWTGGQVDTGLGSALALTEAAAEFVARWAAVWLQLLPDVAVHCTSRRQQSLCPGEQGVWLQPVVGLVLGSSLAIT